MWRMPGLTSACESRPHERPRPPGLPPHHHRRLSAARRICERLLETAGLRISLSATRTGPGSIEGALRDHLFRTRERWHASSEPKREGVDAVVVELHAIPPCRRRGMRVDPGHRPLADRHAKPRQRCLGHTFTVLTVLTGFYGRSSRTSPPFMVLRGKLCGRPRGRTFRCSTWRAHRRHTGAAGAVARKVDCQDGAHAVVFGVHRPLGWRRGGCGRGCWSVATDIPVIDPIPERAAWRRCLVEGGLSHSKLTWPATARQAHGPAMAEYPCAVFADGGGMDHVGRQAKPWSRTTRARHGERPPECRPALWLLAVPATVFFLVSFFALPVVSLLAIALDRAWLASWTFQGRFVLSNFERFFNRPAYYMAAVEIGDDLGHGGAGLAWCLATRSPISSPRQRTSPANTLLMILVLAAMQLDMVIRPLRA